VKYPRILLSVPQSLVGLGNNFSWSLGSSVFVTVLESCVLLFAVFIPVKSETLPPRLEADSTISSGGVSHGESWRIVAHWNPFHWNRALALGIVFGVCLLFGSQFCCWFYSLQRRKVTLPKKWNEF
jgi:hypothetical protein